jgi:hypothetical protein
LAGLFSLIGWADYFVTRSFAICVVTFLNASAVSAADLISWKFAASLAQYLSTAEVASGLAPVLI